MPASTGLFGKPVPIKNQALTVESAVWNNSLGMLPAGTTITSPTLSLALDDGGWTGSANTSVQQDNMSSLFCDLDPAEVNANKVAYQFFCTNDGCFTPVQYIYPAAATSYIGTTGNADAVADTISHIADTVNALASGSGSSSSTGVGQMTVSDIEVFQSRSLGPVTANLGAYVPDTKCNYVRISTMTGTTKYEENGTVNVASPVLATVREFFFPERSNPWSTFQISVTGGVILEFKIAQ